MKKSINDFPFFVGAHLRFKGGPVDGLCFPKQIIEDLQQGYVITIVDISENGNPRFAHSLNLDTEETFYWSLIDIEADRFELLNPRPEFETKPQRLPEPLKVRDLHPKDIALVQAMHIAHRTQQRAHSTGELEHDVVSTEYLTSGFLDRSINAIKALKGYGPDLITDLTINYNLKGVK